MEIRIGKESDVPIRHQLVEQVVFLIVTEKLKPGQAMPSVRELGRRLKIHHNTVSEAYQELVNRKWLVRRRGSRLVVLAPEGSGPPSSANGLDDLINATIATARRLGFSLQALRERVRQRLLAEAPDHLLVVEQAPGLRRLLVEEMRSALPWPVTSCSLENLAGNPGLAIGALAVATQYSLPAVNKLLPKDRQAASMAFCGAEEHLERIRRLRQPSVIALVSVSRTFLRTGKGLLAPAVGKHHTLCAFQLPLEKPDSLHGADLVFCDSVAMGSVKHPRRIHGRVIAPESLDYLASAMQSYQER